MFSLSELASVLDTASCWNFLMGDTSYPITSLSGVLGEPTFHSGHSVFSRGCGVHVEACVYLCCWSFSSLTNDRKCPRINAWAGQDCLVQHSSGVPMLLLILAEVGCLWEISSLGSCFTLLMELPKSALSWTVFSHSVFGFLPWLCFPSILSPACWSQGAVASRGRHIWCVTNPSGVAAVLYVWVLVSGSSRLLPHGRTVWLSSRHSSMSCFAFLQFTLQLPSHSLCAFLMLLCSFSLRYRPALLLHQVTQRQLLIRHFLHNSKFI